MLRKKMMMLANALFIAASTMLLISSCATAQHSKGGFTKIFDGESLKGWKGDSTYWRVENNSIVGEVTPQTILKSNTFIIYQGGELGDFELKAEFKITEAGNSGINYRSELFTEVPYALKGYQADIDGNNVYTGQNYEERGRGFLAKRGESAVLEAGKDPQIVSSLGNGDSLKNIIKANDWNTIRIVAKGNKLRHYINGVLMSEVTDNDASKRKEKGLLGFQVHVGPPMRVEYKNVYLKQNL
jgi:hypothetical protein